MKIGEEGSKEGKKEGRKEEGGRATVIKSNNPHLAGGEKHETPAIKFHWTACCWARLCMPADSCLKV